MPKENSVKLHVFLWNLIARVTQNEKVMLTSTGQDYCLKCPVPLCCTLYNTSLLLLTINEGKDNSVSLTLLEAKCHIPQTLEPILLLASSHVF